MTDPARPQPEPAAHPVHGDGVTGEGREPQIGPVRLRHRADQCPVGRAAHDGVQREIHDAVTVVVLDEQRLRMAGEDGTKFAGALRADRRARRVLRTGGDHDRPRALPQRAVRLAGQRALVVEGDRDGAQAEGRDQVEQAAPAGVLHRHRVAGLQMRAEYALDGVERSGGDGDGAVGHAVRVEGGAGQPLQLRVDAGGPVQRGRRDGARGGSGQRLAERRQQGGVGVARRDVPDALRRFHAYEVARRAGGPGADPAPAPPGRLDHSPVAQSAVGGRDRIGIDPQFGRQLPYRRQRFARGQLSGAHRPFHAR